MEFRKKFELKIENFRFNQVSTIYCFFMSQFFILKSLEVLRTKKNIENDLSLGVLLGCPFP